MDERISSENSIFECTFCTSSKSSSVSNNFIMLSACFRSTDTSVDAFMKASTEVSVERKHAESMMKLLDTLDDLDDVQKVHSNIEFSDEILSSIDERMTVSQ